MQDSPSMNGLSSLSQRFLGSLDFLKDSVQLLVFIADGIEAAQQHIIRLKGRIAHNRGMLHLHVHRQRVDARLGELRGLSQRGPDHALWSRHQRHAVMRHLVTLRVIGHSTINSDSPKTDRCNTIRESQRT